MKTLYFIQLYVVIFLFSYPLYGAITLEEAFRKTVEQSHLTKMESTRTLQQIERKEEAKAQLWPQLQLGGTYFRQDQTEVVTRGSSTNNPQETTKLTLSWPLFRGLKEFDILKMAQFNIDAQKEQEKQSQIELFKLVAQNYYLILSLQSDLKDLSAQQQLTFKRVQELNQRVDIGRSRKTDLLLAISQRDELEAQILQVKSSLTTAVSAFVSLTGIDTLSPQLNDSQQPPKTEKLENYLKQVLNRPDIISIEKQILSSEKNVDAVKSDRYPTVQLLSNYYFKRTTQPNTKWDVGITITFPLFDGGTNHSIIQGSVLVLSEKKLILAETYRKAQLEVEQHLTAINQGVEQLKARERAISSAQRAYEELLNDYHHSLATHLDLIQIENTLLQTKQNYHRLRYQVQLSWCYLQAALGKTPVEN